MNKIRAFVGHSFAEDDEPTIKIFLDYFNSLTDIGFEWETAERAEPRTLSIKVRQKIEGKDLFIGIFTVKNRQIDPSKLKQNAVFKRDHLSGHKADFNWNTSDWVIQESGYALGKGMELIILLEEGLNPIGGLQGDLNYIPFSRSCPSLCFQEVNEMITSLFKARKESFATKETKEKPNVSSPEVSSKPAEEEKKRDSFGELLKAIKEKDEKREQELLAEQLKEAKGDKFKEIDFTCWYHWLRYRFGGSNELENFQKLLKENPEHPSPHIWLGNLYEEYKNYDKSADHFMKAAMYSKEESERTTFLCRSSKVLLQAKKYLIAEDRLLKRLYEINNKSDEENYEILKTLAAIALERKQFDKYYSLAEKALDLNPSDDSLRFELASTYSSNSRHNMSLYHYKILCDTSPNTANLNNMGVAYAELTLGGKAVSAYKKSEELGGSTSVGNLAHKLIAAGFWEEARKKLEDTLKKQEECDSNVPSALSTLEQVIKAEDDKEKEILSSIDVERQFRVDYAEAYTSKYEISSLPKKWMSQFGELDLSIKGNQLLATGKTVVPQMGLAAIPNPYRRQLSMEPEQETLTQTISYEGLITNRAIDFNLLIKTVPTKEYDRSTLAGGLLGRLAGLSEKENSYSGIMIVEENCKKISVMQKDSKGTISFYDLSSVESQ